MLSFATQHTPPRGPHLVFWETTTSCNLACRHCRRLETSEEAAERDLSTEQARDLIDDIAETGKPLLILSGGEPLMREDLFEICQYARDRDIPLALATNGTLIDPATADRIKNAGIRRVSISLDGPNAKINDAFRGLPGTFDKAVRSIGLLRERGIPTQINFTLARHNAAVMEKMFDLARDLGVDALHLFMLVPVGCGVEIAPEEMLSPAEYEDALERFHDLSIRHADVLETRATCAPHYYRIVSQKGTTASGQHARQRRASRGCLAGISVCFISHSGEVFPCGYLPVSAGNVLKERLFLIWQNAAVFRELREYGLLKGKCGECSFVTVCGGCRARAYAATGDYLASEPFCTYNPRKV